MMIFGGILGTDAFKSPQTGSMAMSILLLIGLMVLSLILGTCLKEAQTLKVQ